MQLTNQTVLLAGGTGTLGLALAGFLELSGYKIRLLTRSIKKDIIYDQFLWNPAKQYIDPESLEDVPIVINLAGASIAGKRWSKKYKSEIYDSRVNSTRFLVNTLNNLTVKPTVFISASGTGIYGDRPNEILTEKSHIENNSDKFLIKVCLDWEGESMKVSDSIRMINMRLAPILCKQDGLIKKSMFASKMGITPVLVPGKQIYSWLHIDDFVLAVRHCISDTRIHGVVNFSSPQAIPQKVFYQKMSKAASGLSISMPVFKWMLQIVVGEVSEELFISQNVYPECLLKNGYTFKFENVDEALKDLFTSG